MGGVCFPLCALVKKMSGRRIKWRIKSRARSKLQAVPKCVDGQTRSCFTYVPKKESNEGADIQDADSGKEPHDKQATPNEASDGEVPGDQAMGEGHSQTVVFSTYDATKQEGKGTYKEVKRQIDLQGGRMATLSEAKAFCEATWDIGGKGGCLHASQHLVETEVKDSAWVAVFDAGGEEGEKNYMWFGKSIADPTQRVSV